MVEVIGYYILIGITLFLAYYGLVCNFIKLLIVEGVVIPNGSYTDQYKTTGIKCLIYIVFWPLWLTYFLIKGIRESLS